MMQRMYNVHVQGREKMNYPVQGSGTLCWSLGETEFSWRLITCEFGTGSYGKDLSYIITGYST